MPNFKLCRINENIKRAITAAMTNLNDPRIVSSLISVVGVDVTADLSLCRVYISSLNGIENAKLAVEALNSASGIIRHEISKLKLRRIPEIVFYFTDSIEYGANIEKIINNLHKDSEKS